ncbi:hypothetical protein, partial [Alistipes putredinis]
FPKTKTARSQENRTQNRTFMRNGAKTGLPTYPATEKARTLFYDQTGTECNEKENSTINFNESK